MIGDLSRMLITRRTALTGAMGSLLLAGCDRLSASPTFAKLLETAERLNKTGQRVVLSSNRPLAREYSKADISLNFKANGTVRPVSPDYRKHQEESFANWKLEIGGLVKNPLSLSLEEIRAMPSRTQITRHDCVEGWSAIGEWTGVPLSTLLERAELMPNVRYILFRCADDLTNSRDGSGLYYETIDLVDAFHPQTILAHQMNGETLSVPHGAPIRVRIERQLGYKMAKYIMRIEAVEEFSKIGLGRGGFWEDRGYEWYAGI